MINVGYLALFLCGLAYSSAQAQQQQEGDAPALKDEDRRPLTDTGFLRYGDPFYVYPSREERRPQAQPRDPTLTNEIENPEESRKRPLFIFTTFDAPLSSQQLPSNSGPYIEIRKKRSVEAEKPLDGVVGLLRKKRSHCRKCGGGGGYGGYGGGYPVSYQVYPVYTSYVPTYTSYYPSYGGDGCNTCGKGGFGGGSSGSWSKSSSSSKSSSGSWGYGK